MTLRDAWRARVVEEAKSWLNTPYHSHGRIKGAGTDCAMLLAEVGEATGLCEKVEPGFYSPQWHLHQNRQLLQEVVERYCFQFDGPPLPGDVVLIWYGHTYAHTLIVVEWPMVIHASMQSRCVELADASKDPHLKRCEKLYYRPNVWRD